MPIGKIQRKASNETLSSIDGTLDSRLSSTDIPKMELLKINYVHQCKQAIMTKTEPTVHATPPSIPRLQKPSSTKPSSHQNPSTNGGNFKFAAYKKPPLTTTTHAQQHNLSNISSSSRKLATNCQPLPPPTIESWQFLQNKRALNSPPKQLPNQKSHKDMNAPCRHSMNSSNASDSDQCQTDSTLSPGCERSNSWDYRSKVSTCDIRRDIARAGIKSRADRIARIEKSECEHRQQNVASKQSVQIRAPTVKQASSAQNVTQINQVLEHQKQQTPQKEVVELRRRALTPPQPKHQAPDLVLPPMKVPNARKRGITPPKPISNGHERVFRRNSQEDCCNDCNCRPVSPPIESRHSLGNRPPPPVPDNATSKLSSRIPKPISGEVNRSSSTSAMFFSEASEQLQRKVQQRFQPDHQQGKSIVEKTPTKTFSSTSQDNQRESPFSKSSLEQLREQLPKHTRQLSSHHHRTKVERIHIRKKRQPLLIINQLTNEPPKNFTENSAPQNEPQNERQSCGYKNCNFVNCPMSTQSSDANEDSELTNKLKRLSLGSNSDSGISSEDHHQLKENNFKNMNEACADCEEILRNQSAKNTACTRDIHAYAMVQKMSPTKDLSPAKELCEKETDKHNSQVKITVGKQTDLNDVQNFAKKNLTKATTDEIITAAINSSISKGVANKVSKSKQCNIDNDLKNNEQRSKINNNLRKQTIRIDDNWIDVADDVRKRDRNESAAKSTSEGSRISADNCVKIFVRSADDGALAGVQNKRVSAVSKTSFASHSSKSSAQSGTSATASSSSASSSTSCTSASSTTSITSGSSCCGGFSSGCGRSSVTDTQSLCDSEKDCCCHLAEPCNVAGIFFNQSMISNSDACEFDNCSAIMPAHGNSERRGRDCVTSASTKNAKIGCDLGGVFWNSSYFYNDAEAGDNPCCCSLSSCDDDNCSYYDDDCGSNVGTGGSIVDVSVVDNDDDVDDDNDRDSCCGNCRRQHCLRQIDRIDKDNFALVQQRRKMLSSEEQQQQRKQQMRLIRNSSAEMHLLRSHKTFRKTDVIHDMRPRSMDGIIDSGVSLNGDTGSSPDSIEHLQSQQDSEARRLKRGHVLSELLETERIYVNEMSSILKGYCDQMQSEELSHLVPASLQGKEDLLFGNLHELYTFHNEIFLKDLENCISTTELVALCFVQRRDTFYRLYSFYCQNIPRSDRLRETLVDTHLFLQECQKRLGHKLPLAAYLLKPVQRITKYQLLLKDLLRFSDSGSCTKELQKALDCMLIVLKCVNDSMHQVAITGFPSDLAQQGELLLQDSFQVWTEAKKDIRLRIKPQQRHIFLYQKSMLFCKQTSKTGHNKSTYQFKHYLKMSQIGLTESVRGDVKRFEVWLQGRQEVHTLQAPTLEIKNKWVAEIKRVLLNQLEELKGEKIKQYGLNHRGLRQTTSWDTPNILMGTPQRTISCDGSSESSNRNSNCSSSGDDNCCTSTPGALAGAGGISLVSSTSTTTTDKDAPPDVCGGGWSSDYSNSEDEMSTIEDNSTPGSKFIALADYVAMGHSEVSMREGDSVELLKVGCAGWWFVRVLEANAEGWTPAAYLESFNRKSSRSSSRNQERMNVQPQKHLE